MQTADRVVRDEDRDITDADETRVQNRVLEDRRRRACAEGGTLP